MGETKREHRDLQSELEAYFQRDVAKEAASSLTDSAEIQIKVTTTESEHHFSFRKQSGQNRVLPGPSSSPQVTFEVTQSALDQILEFPSEDIGEIGVHIAKLIVSNDPQKKVRVKVHSGPLSLLSKGYFGVIKAGGRSFAQFLASHGLKGMSAIKSAISKKKG